MDLHQNARLSFRSVWIAVEKTRGASRKPPAYFSYNSNFNGSCERNQERASHIMTYFRTDDNQKTPEIPVLAGKARVTRPSRPWRSAAGVSSLPTLPSILQNI
jgi:hypothetical protein